MQIHNQTPIMPSYFFMFFCATSLLLQSLSAKTEFSLQMPKEVAKIYYEMKGLDTKPQEQNQNSDEKQGGKNNKKQTQNNDEQTSKKATKTQNINMQINTQKDSKKISKVSNKIQALLQAKKATKAAQTTHYFPQDVLPPLQQPPSFEQTLLGYQDSYAQNQQLCQMGDKLACFYAGQAILYAGGDLFQAQQYYWLSCALGMQLSCDEYQKISMGVDMLYHLYYQRWNHKVWVGNIRTKSGKYIPAQKVRPTYKIRNMQPR